MDSEGTQLAIKFHGRVYMVAEPATLRGGARYIEVGIDSGDGSGEFALDYGSDAETFAQDLIRIADHVRKLNTPILCDGVSTKEASE